MHPRFEGYAFELSGNKIRMAEPRLAVSRCSTTLFSHRLGDFCSVFGLLTTLSAGLYCFVVLVYLVRLATVSVFCSCIPNSIKSRSPNLFHFASAYYLFHDKTNLHGTVIRTSVERLPTIIIYNVSRGRILQRIRAQQQYNCDSPSTREPNKNDIGSLPSYHDVVYRENGVHENA